MKVAHHMRLFSCAPGELFIFSNTLQLYGMHFCQLIPVELDPLDWFKSVNLGSWGEAHLSVCLSVSLSLCILSISFTYFFYVMSVFFHALSACPSISTSSFFLIALGQFHFLSLSSFSRSLSLSLFSSHY